MNWNLAPASTTAESRPTFEPTALKLAPAGAPANDMLTSWRVLSNSCIQATERTGLKIPEPIAMSAVNRAPRTEATELAFELCTFRAAPERLGSFSVKLSRFAVAMLKPRNGVI